MTRDWLAALGLYVVVLGLYLSTLCPSVFVEGSGELIGAVWWLGTPHPTGYPLYTLLARSLAAMVPGATPALAVNAATAMLSAACAPALFVVLRRQLRVSVPGAALSALAVAGGATYWSQAVIAEVYGLFVLLAILVVGVCLRAGRTVDADRPRWLLLSGYVAGLAALTHLQAVLLVPWALLAALAPGLRRPGSWSRISRECALLGVGLLLGASLLVYLPVRNMLGPAFHWGPIEGLGGLWDHATGALYRPAFVWLPAEALVAALVRLARQLSTEWPILLLPGALWGGCVIWCQNRALAGIGIAAAAANLAVGLLYHRDPSGLDVFFLLLVTIIAAGLGIGWEDLLSRVRGLPPQLRHACLVVAGLAVSAHGFVAADRSQERLPDAFGRRLLEELPDEAVLLTEGDEASYIVDYLHRVEGVRPDVRVVNRMGRGTTLVPGGTAAAQREAEVRLLSGGAVMHFLAPRAMPLPGYRFVPFGLTYRAVAETEQATVGPSPLALTDGLDPVDPWVQRLLASCWYMEGERLRWLEDPVAAESYRRAAAAAPRSQSMHYNVAVRLLQLNYIGDALMYAHEAIALDPLRRGPYLLAGRILAHQGRRIEAEALYKRAREHARIP